MRLTVPVLSILLLCAPCSCSSKTDSSDPWAQNEGEGGAPRTEGFGDEDFRGPQRRGSQNRGPDTGPENRSGSDLSGPEDCNDKIDNDGNGTIDCNDPSCSADPGCLELGFEDWGRSGKQTLADLRGYIVVLNFWASWCAPCRKEVPALELTWQLYRDKHVVVIGISIDDKKSDAEDFLGSFPVSYPMLHDKEGKNAAKTWQVKSVPTLILIDGAGKIRERHQGYSPALMRKTVVAIDELLEE